MRQFAEASERIRGTSKKLEKVRIVADYLKSSPLEEASVAAVFLSGTPFPAWEETTLQVGGRLLWQVIEELSGRSSQELTAAYRKHGDLGAAAAEVLEASDMGPGRAKLGSLEAPADPGRTDRASVREGAAPVAAVLPSPQAHPEALHRADRGARCRRQAPTAAAR